MSDVTLPADPAAMIEALDPETIRDHLIELDRQSRALRVLLRAAIARRRSTARRAQREEVGRAD